MSDQNIISPSAPPLYPTLPDESEAPNVASFRLKKICDCQKELEIEICHYWKVSKKYKRANSITHTSSTLTGVMATVLSSQKRSRSLSECNRCDSRRSSRRNRWFTRFHFNHDDSSLKLNKKITKHGKTVSLAEAKHLLIDKLIAKAKMTAPSLMWSLTWLFTSLIQREWMKPFRVTGFQPQLTSPLL